MSDLRSLAAPLTLLVVAPMLSGCDDEERTNPFGTMDCPADAQPVRTTADDVVTTWCQTAEGVANGWYEERHADGRLLVEGRFASDLADGAWTYYDDQERIEEEQQWASAIRCGTWRTYAAGNLATEVDYGDCEAVPPVEPPPGGPPTADELGVWNGDACDAGAVEGGTRDFKRYKVCVVDGVWEGPYTSWTPSGAVYESGTYAAGQRDGGWQRFWSNGALAAEGAMVADDKQGAWTHYDPLERRTEEITWTAGVLDGSSTRWFSDGELEEQRSYAMGVATGMLQRFYPNGQLAAEGSFAGGYQTGTWRYYRTDGGQSIEAIFGALGLPEGTWTIRYEATAAAGAQYQLQPFVDGVLHGVVRAFWTEGDVPLSEITWHNGFKQGPWVEWFQNGQVSLQGSYANDQFHDTWEGFYEDGTPEREVSFEYGSRTGTWTYWWQNSQVRGTGTYVDDVAQDGWTFFLEDGTPATAQEVGL